MSFGSEAEVFIIFDVLFTSESGTIRDSMNVPVLRSN